MKFSFIDSIMFNISNHTALFFYFLLLTPIVLPSLIKFINKELYKKMTTYFTFFFLFIIVMSGPLISFIEKHSNKIVCEKVLNLNKDECFISFESKNEEIYKAIYIYGNFKLHKNKIDLETGKDDYYKSKDSFVIYLEREKSLTSSYTLEELFHKKEDVLKMKDEYFKVKKQDLNKVGSL